MAGPVEKTIGIDCSVAIVFLLVSQMCFLKIMSCNLVIPN